jgi:uncharacterized protein (TIGR03435 family)
MMNQQSANVSFGRTSLLAVLGSMVAVASLLITPKSLAQSPTTSVPPTAEKLEFDVASVRQNKSGNKPASNVPLGPGDVYVPSGGAFDAKNFALLNYIAFAYRMTDGQLQSFQTKAPDWVLTDRFNIQARTENRNVTKDQMRLMMRSLLAERFRLAVHYEARQTSAFGLVLTKAGTTGPKLQPHPTGAACSNNPPKSTTPDGSPAPEQPETVAGGFPTICGGILGLPASARDRYSLGARNVPMSLIASSLASWGNLGRPIIDQTGLSGTYDFVLEFTPEPPPAYAQGVDSGGPTFQEALKQQLGLKLESQKGQVDFLVLDHVEHLEEN